MLQLEAVSRVHFIAISAALLHLARSVACESSVLNFSDVFCGESRQSKQGRIVGGTQTSPGEFPWIVSIRYRGSHTCAGVVVTKKWIVTAAHCFCSGSFISPEDNKYDVTINRDGFRNISTQNIKIRHKMVHPEYSCARLENDIAMVELAFEMSWMNVDPACFPIDGEFFYSNLTNLKAVAVGWGATNEDLSIGTIPFVLHKVQVPILANDECEKWYKSQNKTLHLQKSQMCAGYKNGKKDTCWADSGGPLMVKKGTHMVVVGLVSTGIGCARASLPGIYTRLSEFVSWIGEAVS